MPPLIGSEYSTANIIEIVYLKTHKITNFIMKIVLSKITVKCYAMVIMVYACCCAAGYLISGGSSRVRRSSFEPPLFSSVETLYHITSSVVLPPWLNIARYLFAIHSKLIARYPLVSVDQVRFCGELLFFFLIFFFFFFFPHFFFFFFPPYL